jgi:hypothetical protein
LDITFTLAGLGTLTNSGGTVYIQGTFDNTGTLNGSNVLGQAVLYGGTVQGGTATPSGLVFSNYGGTLSGATYDGPLNLTSSSVEQTVDLANGTTVVGSSGSGPGTINVTGIDATLYFDNTQTVSNETINLGNSSGSDYLWENDMVGGDQILTLASSVTINATGSENYIYRQGSVTDELVNQGVIAQTGTGNSRRSALTFSPIAAQSTPTRQAEIFTSSRPVSPTAARSTSPTASRRSSVPRGSPPRPRSPTTARSMSRAAARRSSSPPRSPTFPRIRSPAGPMRLRRARRLRSIAPTRSRPTTPTSS